MASLITQQPVQKLYMGAQIIRLDVGQKINNAPINVVL